jgi:hypothetical protein
MSVITNFTRSHGVKAYAQPYASTSTPRLASADGGNPIHVCYAALTGAMTINATVTDLLQWQLVYFHLTADTTSRVVTLGTGFDLKSAAQMENGTFTVTISNDALLACVYDGAALRVLSLTAEGRATTTEAPAYAASIAITDQAAKYHLVTPGTLTGALTINATAVTKHMLGDRFIVVLTADTTARVVTLGTNIIGAAPQMEGATFTIPISATATLEMFFDGTSLRVLSLSVAGRHATTEAPAYAAAIEVTDQAAKEHLFKPAQLTGALTVDATAVTKHKTGDRFVFMFETDGTQRVVTFGTNFLSSGTVTIPANKTATAVGWFDGTKIRISNREISA